MRFSKTILFGLLSAGLILGVADPMGFVTVAQAAETEEDASVSDPEEMEDGLHEIDNEIYYYSSGSVDSSYEGIAYYNGNWYYVSEGKVDFTFDGVADGTDGQWYVQDGIVDMDANGVLKAQDGWYYISGGKVQTGKETVAKNSNGWWYIGTDGKVDFTKNTVAKNDYGWWCVQNGKVNFSFTGLASNKNGTFYISGGKVNFDVTDVLKIQNDWYYIKGGKLQLGQETVAENSNGWWYIGTDGKVDFTKDTVAKNDYGWWYIEDGKVDFSYDGVASNQHGTWYIDNGKVDFSYTGMVYTNGYYYSVKSGKAGNKAKGVTVMGDSLTTVQEMVDYYNSHATYPSFYKDTDAPTIEIFCQMYYEECEAEGVRAEVAFCQAMCETGFLKYPGASSRQAKFNFAGMGSMSFANVRTGIRAHVQHLKGFACKDDLNQECADYSFSKLSSAYRGCAPYVEWLGINENPSGIGWASAKNYGYTIINSMIFKLIDIR